MAFLWKDWRVLRIMATAPELVAGLYVAAFADELKTQAPHANVKTNVIAWVDDAETVMLRSFLAEISPDQAARVRYALDEEDVDPNEDLAQLGLAYLRAVDNICVAAQPQSPWRLPHAIGYATAQAYLTGLSHHQIKLTETEDQAVKNAWATAVLAKQQLLEAELRLFA